MSTHRYTPIPSQVLCVLKLLPATIWMIDSTKNYLTLFLFDAGIASGLTYIFYAFNGLNLHFQMQQTTVAKLYLQRLSNMFPAPCGDIIYRAMWFLMQFSLMGSKVKGVWCWFTLWAFNVKTSPDWLVLCAAEWEIPRFLAAVMNTSAICFFPKWWTASHSCL